MKCSVTGDFLPAGVATDTQKEALADRLTSVLRACNSRRMTPHLRMKFRRKPPRFTRILLRADRLIPATSTTKRRMKRPPFRPFRNSFAYENLHI